MAIQFPNRQPKSPPISTSPYAAPTADMSIASDYHEGDYNDSKFYSPKGRIGRIQYILYPFCFILVAIVVMFLFFMLLGGFASLSNGSISSSMAKTLGGLFVVILLPALIYINFTATIRRLNDLNRSGWLSLLLFAPSVVGVLSKIVPLGIVGSILAFILSLFPFYLMLARGDEDENNYGLPSPPPTMPMKVTAIGLVLLFFVGGIWAAIAIPAYSSYVKRSQEAKMQAQNQPVTTQTPSQQRPPTATPTAEPATNSANMQMAAPAAKSTTPVVKDDLEKPLLVDKVEKSHPANKPTQDNTQENAKENDIAFAKPANDDSNKPSKPAGNKATAGGKSGNLSYEEFIKMSDNSVFVDQNHNKK